MPPISTHRKNQNCMNYENNSQKNMTIKELKSIYNN